MNILILGNGFDLSHYLPTKYDHFMVAIQAIEGWDTSNGDITFDDLFGELYKNEEWFFGYTKAMYKTENIKISPSDVQDLKTQLQENVWYQYFLHHIIDIDTWIDFENEFSKALDLVAIFSEKVEDVYKIHEMVDPIIRSIRNTENSKYIYYAKHSINKLIKLKILEELPSGHKISSNYYRNSDLNLDIDANKIIYDLEKNLNIFIELFNWYITNIIENLKLKKDKIMCTELSIHNFLIFSFNYTTTFQRLYKYPAEIEYLHGKVNDKLVLGISDLKNDFLRKFKNYSFTKYHQKLLKNTDYLFLRENPKIKNLLDSNSIGLRTINITIWGHSLADSDESYIKEIFSLNEKSNLECKVTVYYYGNDAPKLLNNLLDIMGKEIIEHWMKKGWLKFEENPNIVAINNIKPIDLPVIS